MKYIVIFNWNTDNPILMTDGNNRVEKFIYFEDANNEANDWLDGEDYIDFVVCVETDHDRNILK